MPTIAARAADAAWTILTASRRRSGITDGEGARRDSRTAFATDPTDAPLFRLSVEPTEQNGLRAACRLMMDKIATVARTKIGSRVGRLDDEDMVRLNRALVVFLGLAAGTSST